MKLAGTFILLFSAVALLRADVVSPNTDLTAREQQIIAAAKADAKPQFHGARVLGVQPRTPFLQSLAATGARPLTFSVSGLPRGLSFDARSGIVSGMLSAPGKHTFKARAKNSSGEAETEFTIVCGDTLTLTPPMGWNSYDAFGDSVVESEVLANAEWQQERLQPLGWDTVVVDFRWYDSKADGIRNQNPEAVTIDEFGRCVPPANRFPSAANGAGFKPLADKIHAMGLKFGIHIMRGIPRKAVEGDLPIAGSSFKASQAVLPEGDPTRVCVWPNRDMFGVDASTAAGKAWYASLAKQYSAWGVDYIKCDDIANLQRGRFKGAEIETLSRALKDSGRSVVLSLSPGPAPVGQAAHLEKFSNLWRISGDFWDRWGALNRNFDLFAAWQTNSGPGHWADGDMIPFAHICQRNCDVKPDRWTRFTRDEQLTLMSLWALAPSPLMLGMNLPDNDAWTTALLTNPEVLAINQDSAGRAGQRRTAGPQEVETWTKEMSDGAVAVGFFNRSDQPLKVEFPWSKLGFSSARTVRDVWLRKDLGKLENFTTELPPHGCALVIVK